MSHITSHMHRCLFNDVWVLCVLECNMRPKVITTSWVGVHSTLLEASIIVVKYGDEPEYALWCLQVFRVPGIHRKGYSDLISFWGSLVDEDCKWDKTYTYMHVFVPTKHPLVTQNGVKVCTIVLWLTPGIRLLGKINTDEMHRKWLSRTTWEVRFPSHYKDFVTREPSIGWCHISQATCIVVCSMMCGCCVFWNVTQYQRW